MRRFVTFVAVTFATAVGGLWWLHDGDLEDAVGPLIEEIPSSVVPADAKP